MTERDPRSESFPRRFGKYHLLGPLAQGGMGALYLAVTGDAGLERLLVIKTVLPHIADEEYVARFRDEAKVVVKLSHANLIPVFDAGQVDGELFLAMDFVEGKDLRAVWNQCAKKGVAFPVDVAVYLVKELCRGLGYAHSFGDLKLVHRDVSPPNVLISYQGEVKLTDFGLASSTLKLEKTAPGIIYGKIAYMSPEQARGDELDGRSDLYSAGIVLWELLTGRQLFAPGKEQPQELIQRAREPEVPAPSERAPRVPAEIDAIVKKVLAPRPEDRYASGKELKDALAGWLAREAPGTDEARLEAFVTKLFSEDMAREREERRQLLARVRARAESTLPPSHELRRVLRTTGEAGVEGADGSGEDGEGGVAGGGEGDGSIGRRAEDRGDGPRDRRKQPGRRAEDQERSGTSHGVAVDVPKPGPGGRTAVRVDSGNAAEAEEKPLAAEEPAEVIGQVLDQRYKIQELIGEGGMGRVYLAEHVEIGRRVAAKILHPVYGRMPELVERFRREARAATRIGHPHIVDVTDSGATEDGSVYFVMEYLEGLELASVIDHEGALEISRALLIATQICRALAAAHAARIIHRDLKPENVFLVSRSGTSDFVKVLDFGIAKSTEAEEVRAQRLTSPGMAMGTPEYMAPEQAAGKPADARCDVYALGAILYEMLTGAPPYEGENFMEILTKKATVDPAPPRGVRAEIPEVVEELVLQAMARNPHERPKSMEAFEYELTKCLSGRGAAVANVLGMSADDKLAASLNPGGQLGEGPEGPPTFPGTGEGPGTFPGAGQFAPTSPGAGESPASSPGAAAPASGAIAADSGGYAEPPITGVDTTALTDPPRLRKSGVGMWGWGLFGSAIAAGLAITLYVAAAEPGGEPLSAAESDPGGAEGEEPAAVGVDAGAVGDSEEAGDPDERAEAPADSGESELGKAARRSSAADRTDSSQGPPARAKAPSSRSDAEELLSQAQSYEAQLDWEHARRNYQLVARGRHLRGEGLLGLAKVAFETGDSSTAIDYAQRALGEGAGAQAQLVLGHAHFKEDRYEEALRHYDKVLERDPGNDQARTSAEEARNRLSE